MNKNETRGHVGALNLEQRSGGGRVLTGHAALFNSYSQNLGGFVEQIDPSAFNSTLGRSNRVLAVFNHDESQLLGSSDAGTLRLEVDDVGLRYEVDLNMDDPDAQRVAAKAERGDLKGSSFKFRTDTNGDEWSETDQGYPLRTLKSVALFDVGPVTSPAYLGTAAGGAGVALRSLVTDHVTLPELVEAAAADELRSFLNDKPLDDPGSSPVDWQQQVEEAQRAFDALRRPEASPVN